MTIRGIRGAVTVQQDSPEEILAATRELLTAILEGNPGLNPSDLACVFFTLTEDLTSTFPAESARTLGWQHVPMLCSREVPVPGSLPRVIRTLLLWNTQLSQEQVQHVYLGEAQVLRPDLNHNQSTDISSSFPVHEF